MITYKVEVDTDGIWIHSGVLPWEKGTYGLNWRDASDAVYHTGFISWLTKAYTVRVRHRYTKDSELVLENIAKGNILVGVINEHIKELNLY